MKNNGIASGDLSNPITLTSGTYTLSVNGPTNTTYEILAERTDSCQNEASEHVSTSGQEQDLKKGDGNTDAQAPICS